MSLLLLATFFLAFVLWVLCLGMPGNLLLNTGLVYKKKKKELEVPVDAVSTRKVSPFPLPGK